jgi:hypothetical protein
MESKTARFTLLIDPNKKKAFETLCAQQDLTPSQVVRQLIREYLAKHGVTYGAESKRLASSKTQMELKHRSGAQLKSGQSPGQVID